MMADVISEFPDLEGVEATAAPLPEAVFPFLNDEERKNFGT